MAIATKIDNTLVFSDSVFPTDSILEPFRVKIDSSDELNNLVKIARSYRDLAFNEKLKKIRDLCHSAIEINAYVEMCKNEKDLEKNWGLFDKRKEYKNIVLNDNPLSVALKEKAGCCRYQAILFFILGFEAHLGQHHFLQSSKLRENISATFNQLEFDKETHYISIYQESIKEEDKEIYSTDPESFFQNPVESSPRYFYSYHQKNDGNFQLIAKWEKHECEAYNNIK